MKLTKICCNAIVIFVILRKCIFIEKETNLEKVLKYITLLLIMF